jgi:hypothetical protein
MRIDIEHAADAFPAFWEAIGAEGDLTAAVHEFDTRHHEGKAPRSTPREGDRAAQPGSRSVRFGRFRR